MTTGSRIEGDQHPPISRLGHQLNHAFIVELRKLSPEDDVLDQRLHVQVGSVRFKNPVLVAPGPDAEGNVASELYEAGFGGVEVGSIPVQHRDVESTKPGYLTVSRGDTIYTYEVGRINIDTVVSNLARYRGTGIPIGVNLVKNKSVLDEEAPAAFAAAVSQFYDSASYFTLNVSSPNKSGLQTSEELDTLTRVVQATNHQMDEMGKRKPLFIKITENLTNPEIDRIIDLVRENDVTGLIAIKEFVLSNQREGGSVQQGAAVWSNQNRDSQGEMKYRQRGVEIIRYIYEKTNGSLPIIGVGAITNIDSALERIKSGASLIQVASTIYNNGLGIAGQINRGILAEIDRLGLSSIDELIGYDLRHKS